MRQLVLLDRRASRPVSITLRYVHTTQERMVSDIYLTYQCLP